jgi:alkyl hydroperoxide reductase subunit AhpC
MKIPILADLVPLRALFIIDPSGTLRQVTVNDLDEVVRLVKAFAFQLVEEHGEVCPANWTPGAKTLVGLKQGQGVLQRLPCRLLLIIIYRYLFS